MRSTVKAFAITVAASLALAAPAAAKTYEVTKRGDPTPNGCKKKDCSLREAIIAANAHPGTDKVVLPKKKTYNLAIANSIPPGEDEAAEGDLDITDPLRVSHPGKGRAKVDANGIDRVFEVLTGATTTLQKLVVREGDLSTGPEEDGGGIRSDSDLVLRRTNVKDNHVPGYGGGISLQDDGESLALKRSRVIGNVSDDDGGGVAIRFDAQSVVINRSTFRDNEARDWGGGMIAQVPTTITRSRFTDNHAREGSGGGLALEDIEGSSEIHDSTASGNSAGESGGGIQLDNVDIDVTGSTVDGNSTSNFGGGVNVVDDAALSITNATVEGNHSDQEGGGIANPDGTVVANAITVVRNSATGTGGGLTYQIGTPGFRVANSLIALNDAPVSPDCFASDFDPFESEGHNLIGDDTDCDGFDATGDFVNPNPKLGQLKSNGGPTQTVALKKGSPAINKASKASAPKKDQRGVKRGKKPDIGAYERVKKKHRHHHH